MLCRHHIRWWCAWSVQSCRLEINLAAFVLLAVNRPESSGWTLSVLASLSKILVAKTNLFLQDLKMKVSHQCRRKIGYSKITEVVRRNYFLWPWVTQALQKQVVENWYVPHCWQEELGHR